jgi:NaMN:DMB phosphoribosyltransferase
MGLYDRLVGTEDPKIPIHQFMSAAAENVRGEMTDLQVKNAFNLSAAEATEAATLKAQLAGTVSRQELHDVLLLAERGIEPYTTAAAVKTRLGV